MAQHCINTDNLKSTEREKVPCSIGYNYPITDCNKFVTVHFTWQNKRLCKISANPSTRGVITSWQIGEI